MRDLLICLLVALGVVSASAQSTYDRQILTAAVGVPTGSVVVTSTTIRGEVMDITLGLPVAGATGSVSIVSTPEVGPALVLYSDAAFTAAVRTNLYESGVVLVGDTVTFTVTPVSNHSNQNWKAEIKFAR